MFALMNIGLSVEIRMFFAFFTALALSLACGGSLIEYLHSWQKQGQPIRTDGPQSHLQTKKARRQWADC